jgi:hypothetical protein
MNVPEWLVWVVSILLTYSYILKPLWKVIRWLNSPSETGTIDVSEIEEAINCIACRSFPCTHDVTMEKFYKETEQGNKPYCEGLYYEPKDDLPIMYERQGIPNV